MTADTDTSWGAMFSQGRALAAITLASGVGLQAMEAFIVSTLLPSVVGDICGLELFAWNTTVFIVASIVASMPRALHRPPESRSNRVRKGYRHGRGQRLCSPPRGPATHAQSRSHVRHAVILRQRQQLEDPGKRRRQLEEIGTWPTRP